MRTTKTSPGVGSVLSRIGWLAVVLAIVGGLLGMHVIGAVPAMSMEPSEVTSTDATTTALMHTAAPRHTMSPTSPPAGQPAAHMFMPDQQGGPMDCGGSPSEGHASMNGHGTCVPSFGSDILSLPLPGVLTGMQTGTAFTSVPGPKSKGRVPDPPSLTQLSIIRT